MKKGEKERRRVFFIIFGSITLLILGCLLLLLSYKSLTGSAVYNSYGLLSDFKPVVGYSHPFGGGRINLWDKDGRLYIYNPVSKQWLDQTSAQNLAGLPYGFKPVVGYSHPFGGGRINLWDKDGRLYIYNPVSKQWLDQTSAQNLAGLPYGFKPVVGYSHPFGGGRINLWDKDGRLYIYNPSFNDGNGGWIDKTTSKVSLGLPSDFKPVTGYYFNLTDSVFISPSIHLFDKNRFFVYKLNNNNFTEKTDELRLYLLPVDEYPLMGFNDEINNRILLYYSDKVFASTTGYSFQRLLEYLKINLIYENQNRLLLENIEKSKVEQFEEFVGGTVNYSENYVANFFSGSFFRRKLITNYTFDIRELDIFTTPPENCWTNYNGEWVVDYRKCDLRPREQIIIPCGSNINLVSIRNNYNNKVVASIILNSTNRC
ncbi:MAG TPA: hypothetical protein P5277_04240 [Candidatus Paceibacterota bacterium]|nr:hypothetical protein [Candidatus Paceibacterota bacterium]